MGDDIGIMQPSIYHRGLMVGETPNIDRIGNEGGIFMTYYAEESCTAGRNAFFTGMHPLRTGMIPPQLPGSPSYLRPGTPALAKFLHDLGYTTGEFGKNHLGDHTDALPTAHGFQEFWGYLYHLDAMQGVSFPDINKTPTDQTVIPPCKNTSIPGVPEVPEAAAGNEIPREVLVPAGESERLTVYHLPDTPEVQEDLATLGPPDALSTPHTTIAARHGARDPRIIVVRSRDRARRSSPDRVHTRSCRRAWAPSMRRCRTAWSATGRSHPRAPEPRRVS